MSGINKAYQIQLTTLSPLHVGGAQEKHLQKGLDFLELNGQFYTFNLDTICEVIDANDVADSLVQGTLSDLIKRNPEAKKKLQRITSNVNPESEIKAFIKDGFGKHYLPGTSLKGAISSNVFGKLKKNVVNERKNAKELLGDFDNGIFRHIKVGDVYWDKNLQLLNTKIFNLFSNYNNEWKGGWKHGKNTSATFNEQGTVFSYECLPNDSKGTLTLRILDSQSELMKKLKEWHQSEVRKLEEQKRKQLTDRRVKLTATPLPTAFETVISDNPLSFLFKIINEKTKSYIDKEIAFFEKYKVKETDNFVSKLKEFKKQIPSGDAPETCIMRIAHGSGFHSMTGDWQFDDFDKTGTNREGKKNYKSRKLLFSRHGNQIDFSPMGFIKLSTKFEESVAKEIVEEKEEIIEIIEQKPIVAEFFKGQIKENASILDAVVVANNPNQVEVYLNDKTFKIALNYRAEMAIGTVVKVKINVLDKKTMTPKQVGFVGFKTN